MERQSHMAPVRFEYVLWRGRVWCAERGHGSLQFLRLRDRLMCVPRTTLFGKRVGSGFSVIKHHPSIAVLSMRKLAKQLHIHTTTIYSI